MALLSHSLPRPLPLERMGGTGHMGRSSAVRIVALAMLLLAASPGASQQKSLKEQLLDLGTWILVSHEAIRPDGSRAPVYRLNPNGIAFFDAGGHFIITAMRSDRAKYAIANPTQGTPQENQATAHNLLWHVHRQLRSNAVLPFISRPVPSRTGMVPIRYVLLRSPEIG